MTAAKVKKARESAKALLVGLDMNAKPLAFTTTGVFMRSGTTHPKKMPVAADFFRAESNGVLKGEFFSFYCDGVGVILLPADFVFKVADRAAEKAEDQRFFGRTA